MKRPLTEADYIALSREEGPEPVVAPEWNFLAAVRSALDDYDPTAGRDHWRIRDSDRFARILLTHMLAATMATEALSDEQRAAS